MNIYRGLLDDLSRGKRAVMLTSFGAEGGQPLSKIYFTADQLETAGEHLSLTEDSARRLKSALDSGRIDIKSDAQQITIVEPYYPEPNLVILGGGHIAGPLCRFAAGSGFAVTVIDDRPAFADKNRFPDARLVICGGFADSIQRIYFSEHTYVVIVTRGHRHDLECLLAVLPKPWAYAGMIGSKRRVTGILQQLREEGFPADILAKINTPIGLDIGAVTPEEIAVSILAELISFRRLENPGAGTDSPKISRTEFDRRVLEELARGREEKCTIVTVIATKGSVPRKAGAKMLVWPDGTIMGSIGGGCGESAVVREAREAAVKGVCKLLDIDLTGDMAEEMGMVCGGIMQVLLEPWPSGGYNKR